MPPIRVLIVDDSALVRKVLSEGLARHPDIEVVATAVDPYVARDKILALKPDVLTLDVEMPRMDGITFLRLLMKHHPLPVIIMSSVTQAGSDRAVEALAAGAVDVLAKPNGSFSVTEDLGRLADLIRAAARAKLGMAAPAGPPSIKHVATALGAANAALARPVTRLADTAASLPRSLILIGSSTGGTEALTAILPRLPASLPGICIVQHIPAYFSRAFADRLNTLCQVEVREARAGDRLHAGLALVAPGGFHVMLKWHQDHYAVELNEGPKIHHQRPAVDVLFDSALKAGAAPHSLALLLTGMGADGAQGMVRLRDAGTKTIAQDEASCVVFGMPREAIRLGGAERVLSLNQMPEAICAFASRASAPRPAKLAEVAATAG